MMSVLLLGFADDTFTAEQHAAIRLAAGDWEIVQTRDRAAVEAILDRIEIAAGSFPLDLLPRAAALRWLQQWGAGADWLLRHAEVRELDFVLTNASGVHAIPISEHIFAMLLALARSLPQAARAQMEHIWVSNHWQKSHSSTIRPGQPFDFYIGREAVFELAGKVMLLIGVGAIGERTAALAHAFGMRVIGVRRNPDEPVSGVERMVGPGELLAVLPEADVVAITAPLTAETQGLIDRRSLAAMKPSAFLINIGRGATVVEADLIEALQHRQIAGAGLDVFETEPLPADSPLWELPNVLITSHYAGLTPEYDNRALAIFLDNLDRYRRGEPLRNVVDKRLGY